MNKKVIVITGVSSGIGESFVRKVLKAKKSIYVVGLSRNNIEDLSDSRYFFFKTDMSNMRSVKTSFNKLKEKLGRVDVLINNTGFAYRSTFEDLSAIEIKKQFDVNLFGPIKLTQLTLQLMRKQKSGHIINVSSVGSCVSTPTLGYYAAAKVALDKLSDTLRQEVAVFNILVSTLFPGAVKTNFGKNIKLPKKYNMSPYKELYSEWEVRFRNFFKIKNTSEDVANKLLAMLDKPQDDEYMSARDGVMCTLKRILPNKTFQYLFLNYFYKNEG